MPDTPMEKGVPVELLTNYKSAYESVRERKGYGKNNVEHGLKSDTACRATCLQRNFVEREDIRNIINECASVARLSYLLHSIDSCTYSPLIELLRKGQQLSSLQWVALLRIHWIINVFCEKVHKKKCIILQRKERKLNELESSERKLVEMDRKLNEMETTFSQKIKPLLSSILGLTAHEHYINAEITSNVRFELLEEICFPIRLQLPYILDTTKYCPAAVRLIESLSKSIAETCILRDQEKRDELLRELYHRFIDHLSQGKTDVLIGTPHKNSLHLTQIAVVTNAFASNYLKNTSYSLHNVCGALDLDYEHVKAATMKECVDQHTAVNPSKPCARKDGKQTRPAFLIPELVYSGPPTIPCPGDFCQWPDGWTQKSYKRASGASKGHIDHYWYPPDGSKKLRSKVEICAYFRRQAKSSVFEQ